MALAHLYPYELVGYQESTWYKDKGLVELLEGKLVESSIGLEKGIPIVELEKDKFATKLKF